MKQITRTIAKPLIQSNQLFILLSVLAAWLSEQYVILLLPLAAGLLAVLTGYNLVIALFKPFLKKPISSYDQEDYDQQQFNQWIAVSCIGLAFICFFSGWMTAGFIFSGMVVAASTAALAGFCIGCFIRFQWHQYQYRRKNTASEQ
ncbi:DUF4395 domain-containing protein [Fictibacillus iocasae]|uniref:DUF4395 domain-containing protein n=1 Tax=Fictibacillus iocasae TaxID=2715437 RepID=A0ABW2NRF6_9BACL